MLTGESVAWSPRSRGYGINRAERCGINRAERCACQPGTGQLRSRSTVHDPWAGGGTALEQSTLRAADKVIRTHLKGYSRRKEPEGRFNTVILAFADHCPLKCSINTEGKMSLASSP